MPVVENDTEDEMDYRVTDDDPPYDDPPYGRPGNTGLQSFVDKKIPAKAGVEFDGTPGRTQSHFIRLHNGVFLKLLEKQPHNRKVTFKREGGSDVCTFTLSKVGPQGPPGES